MSIRYTVQGFEPTTSRTLSSPLTTKPGRLGMFWMAPMMANSYGGSRSQKGVIIRKKNILYILAIL